MIVWDALNTLISICVTLIICFKLTHFRDLFNAAERIGMGIAGGSSILRIPVLWQPIGAATDGWAGTLFALGWFLYLCGRMSRHYRHARQNEIARHQARTHFAQRGPRDCRISR